MAHFHLLNQTPLLGSTRTKDTEVGITNGTKGVSMTLKRPEVDFPDQYLTLTPENARKIAVALLVGAFNVDGGIHANTGAAREYDDLSVALQSLRSA